MQRSTQGKEMQQMKNFIKNILIEIATTDDCHFNILESSKTKLQIVQNAMELFTGGGFTMKDFDEMVNNLIDDIEDETIQDKFMRNMDRLHEFVYPVKCADIITSNLSEIVNMKDGDYETSASQKFKLEIVQKAVQMFQIGSTMKYFEDMVNHFASNVPDKKTRDNFKRNKERFDDCKYHVRCAWMVNKGPDDNGTIQGILRSEKAVIDVIGDGSCFYQALFYQLLWIRDEVCYMEKPSIYKLKTMIINKIFQRNGTGYIPGVIEAMLQLQYDYALGENFGKEEAMEVLGLGWSEETSQKYKDADQLVLDLASIAFDVQIILYTIDKDEEDMASLCFASGNGIDFQFSDDNKIIFKYNGKHTLCFLFTDRGQITGNSHYSILTRYMKLADLETRGRTIPYHTTFRKYYNPKEHPWRYQMPKLERRVCMGCGKLILAQS